MNVRASLRRLLRDMEFDCPIVIPCQLPWRFVANSHLFSASKRRMSLLRASTFLSLSAVLLACPLRGVESSAVPARPPGVIIDHLAAGTTCYVGSPSLAVLPNGRYVASHDVFGKGSKSNRTVVFESADKGESWKRLAEIEGQRWSTLFVHRDALYLMGTSRGLGFATIRRSTDGGKTWTEPVDTNSGLLLGDGKYHCAPVPVVVHNGRIWRAMEDAMGPGGWGSHFRAFMMSAPEGADLLKAESWVSSNRIGRDTNWLSGKFDGWLEGNAVITPNGEVVDMLRVASREYPERAAVIQISADGKTATFNPKKGFIEFPGGAKKFTIRFDPKTKRYWSLANHVPKEFQSTLPDKTRNTLALVSSRDLNKWKVHSILMQHPDTTTHGFQYVDWSFENDDIIATMRTAYDDEGGGAHNYHDANYLTFYLVRNFRLQ